MCQTNADSFTCHVQTSGVIGTSSRVCSSPPAFQVVPYHGISAAFSLLNFNPDDERNAPRTASLPIINVLLLCVTKWCGRALSGIILRIFRENYLHFQSVDNHSSKLLLVNIVGNGWQLAVKKVGSPDHSFSAAAEKNSCFLTLSVLESINLIFMVRYRRESGVIYYIRLKFHSAIEMI